MQDGDKFLLPLVPPTLDAASSSSLAISSSSVEEETAAPPSTQNKNGKRGLVLLHGALELLAPPAPLGQKTTFVSMEEEDVRKNNENRSSSTSGGGGGGGASSSGGGGGTQRTFIPPPAPFRFAKKAGNTSTTIVASTTPTTASTAASSSSFSFPKSNPTAGAAATAKAIAPPAPPSSSSSSTSSSPFNSFHQPYQQQPQQYHVVKKEPQKKPKRPKSPSSPHDKKRWEYVEKQPRLRNGRFARTGGSDDDGSEQRSYPSRRSARQNKEEGGGSGGGGDGGGGGGRVRRWKRRVDGWEELGGWVNEEVRRPKCGEIDLVFERHWRKVMVEGMEEYARFEALDYVSIPHALESESDTHTHTHTYDVVLVTQCSIDRLPALEAQAKAWQGPVSVCVYINTSSPERTQTELEAVYDFFKRMPAGGVCGKWTIGLVFGHECRYTHTHTHTHTEENEEEKEKKGNGGGDERVGVGVRIAEGSLLEDSHLCLYPINKLRNVALLQARGDPSYSHVFLVDVDFIPSAGLYHALVCGQSGLETESVLARMGKGEALVVPAFSLYNAEEEESGGGEGEMEKMTLQDLHALYAKGQATGFHMSHFPQGHRATDFEQWWARSLSASSSSSSSALSSSPLSPYPITYEECFEPYILVHKASIPLYDERFRGYGMNKITHLFAACAPSRTRTDTHTHTHTSTSSITDTDTTTSLQTDTSSVTQTHTDTHTPLHLSVLPGHFLLAKDHPKSHAYEQTYGDKRDVYRKYYLQALYTQFKKEVGGEGKAVVLSGGTVEMSMAKEKEEQKKKRKNEKKQRRKESVYVTASPPAFTLGLLRKLLSEASVRKNNVVDWEKALNALSFSSSLSTARQDHIVNV